MNYPAKIILSRFFGGSGIFSANRKKKYSFKVEIKEVTSRVGFSFAKDGWHPFVQTLQEYIKNPNLRYEDSTLSRLYSVYQPGNLQELMLDHVKIPLPPICFWPASNELIKRIWIMDRNQLEEIIRKEKTKKDGEEGWIYFGPHSQEYGENEFKRLISVYDSIKTKGYLSRLGSEEPVNGFFLKKGKATRFILMQGNHRVSALKVLGYSNVGAIIRPGHPQIINWDDLYRFTEEAGGIYPISIIQQIFLALFEESGLEKGRRYKLTGVETGSS